MPHSIEISDKTFARLESRAIGFDTPESVIIRLLDDSEGLPEKKPILSFNPDDESIFLKKLIENKEAEVVLYKTDGKREVTRWKANKISGASNLRANLWSGFLRGWKQKGIVSAEFTVLPRGLNDGEDETEQKNG